MNSVNNKNHQNEVIVIFRDYLITVVKNASLRSIRDCANIENEQLSIFTYNLSVMVIIEFFRKISLSNINDEIGTIIQDIEIEIGVHDKESVGIIKNSLTKILHFLTIHEVSDISQHTLEKLRIYKGIMECFYREFGKESAESLLRVIYSNAYYFEYDEEKGQYNLRDDKIEALTDYITKDENISRYINVSTLLKLVTGKSRLDMQIETTLANIQNAVSNSREWEKHKGTIFALVFLSVLSIGSKEGGEKKDTSLTQRPSVSSINNEAYYQTPYAKRHFIAGVVERFNFDYVTKRRRLSIQEICNIYFKNSWYVQNPEKSGIYNFYTANNGKYLHFPDLGTEVFFDGLDGNGGVSIISYE